MPWRGAEVPNEFPTLGYLVADWIEERCAIPDREFVGDPYLLTDEQLHFLLNYYRLNPKNGEFHFRRGGQLTRPQKWGKGPLSAAIICAEAQGPVLFDGWDANGEPVGKPWPTPLIQVTALSEDQADNVYSALLPMIELGALHGEIEDTGLGRINLPGGGKIEPVTASGRSRLGQRVTFIVQDQTESWTESNKGRLLADNQRRNIAGMAGRWLSTCNAWDPVENSVAQYTAEHEHDGVYHDDVEPPEGLSIRNKAERRRALRKVYGDSVTGQRDEKRGAVKPWIDLDRIEDEIRALVGRDAAQAERFFLNRKRASEAAAFNGAKWDELAKPGYQPEPGALIVVGADGARFIDDFGLIGTEIETGHQFVIGHWHRPDDAPDNYEHPLDEIDGAMEDAYERFTVWRVYVDPGSASGNVDLLVEKWEGRYGKVSVESANAGVVPWFMHRPRQTAFAVATYADAIEQGDLSHDGDEAFAQHIKNATRWKVNVRDDDGRQLHVIGKDRADSPNKMDLAAAGVLSWEARGDAIAKDAQGEDNTVYFL